MKRTLCILHAWKGRGRCPFCAEAKPMDSRVSVAERAFNQTLAFIDGKAFTSEQAELLRDRLAGYGGGEV